MLNPLVPESSDVGVAICVCILPSMKLRMAAEHSMGELHYSELFPKFGNNGSHTCEGAPCGNFVMADASSN